MRKMLALTGVFSLVAAAWVGSASADPWKDESGKGRERGGYARYDSDFPGRGYGRELRFDRDEFRGRGYGGEGERRRERRAFKEEYDDGNCKVERKLEKSGEYKEERKCRGGPPGRAYRSYGSRY